MTKNKTTVKPLSNHIVVYHKQPTTKNTKPGDVVLYKKEVWINDGHIVMSIPSIDLDDDIDKNSTVLKPLTKNYADEKALKENTMDNYIMINGKKIELTEEQLNYLCMFNRFAQMAKEQFGLTITPKEFTNETFETLFGFGVDFSDCSKRNNPFNDRPKVDDIFYYITSDGVRLDDNDDYNANMITAANSFNDEAFAYQIYLHELLNRKLLKYAYDNNAEDREWDKASVNSHYFIYFDSAKGHFVVGDNYYCHSQSIYFSSENVAKQAIQDVVEPFLAEHPEFVW